MLLAIGLYLIFIPVWLLTLNAIAWFAATVAQWIYLLLDPLISIKANGNTVDVVVMASAQSGFGGQVYSQPLRVDTVTYGLPVIAALVLVTRADSTRAKLRALAIGMIVMLVTSVPAVMMWAKLTSLQLEEQLARAAMSTSGDRSSFFYYAFHGYAFSQPVIAVAVWLALLMFGLFKDKKKQPLSQAIARNVPCPCGSGRKYKRCCGRA